MRIDKFLSIVGILKRRKQAQEMLKNNSIFINSIPSKPSKEVKIGDVIEIQYVEYVRKFIVLNLPSSKSIPKSSRDLYFKELK